MQFDSVVPPKRETYASRCVARVRQGQTRASDRGFSLMETLMVLVILSTLSSIAINNLQSLTNDLQSATVLMSAFLKEARAKAISQTAAYHVTPSGPNTLVTSSAVNCSTPTRVPDPSLQMRLPTGVSLSATNWDVCFTSRGLSTTNITLSVTEKGRTKSIEVMLGGGVRTL